MCLSIPAKVVCVTGEMADVSIGGSVFKAGLQLLENIEPGDYILLHAGFGIQKISEEEALITLKLLHEINATQFPET